MSWEDRYITNIFIKFSRIEVLCWKMKLGKKADIDRKVNFRSGGDKHRLSSY